MGAFPQIQFEPQMNYLIKIFIMLILRWVKLSRG